MHFEHWGGIERNGIYCLEWSGICLMEIRMPWWALKWSGIRMGGWCWLVLGKGLMEVGWDVSIIHPKKHPLPVFVLDCFVAPLFSVQSVVAEEWVAAFLSFSLFKKKFSTPVFSSAKSFSPYILKQTHVHFLGMSLTRYIDPPPLPVSFKNTVHPQKQ